MGARAEGEYPLATRESQVHAKAHCATRTFYWKAASPEAFAPGPVGCSGAARYFFSIFRRSISFLSASRFMTLNSTRRFFDMLSADVFGTSGRLEP